MNFQIVTSLLISYYTILVVASVFGDDVNNADQVMANFLNNHPLASYVGHVDGKHFLVDNTVRLTHREAKVYAFNASLYLAALSTINEAYFIKNATLDKLPAGAYWTSLTNRGIRLSDRFKWETTNVNYADDFPMYFLTYGACVMLSVNSDSTKQLNEFPHSSRLGVLLQIDNK